MMGKIRQVYERLRESAVGPRPFPDAAEEALAREARLEYDFEPYSQPETSLEAAQLEAARNGGTDYINAYEREKLARDQIREAIKESWRSMTEAQRNAAEDGFMSGFEGKLGVAPTKLNDPERAAWEEGYQMAQRIAVPNGRPDGFEGVAKYKDESKASSYAYVVFDDVGKRPKEVASFAVANKIAADYNHTNPGSRAVPLTSREYATAGGATGKWGQAERPRPERTNQQARGMER